MVKFCFSVAVIIIMDWRVINSHSSETTMPHTEWIFQDHCIENQVCKVINYMLSEGHFRWRFERYVVVDGYQVHNNNNFDPCVLKIFEGVWLGTIWQTNYVIQKEIGTTQLIFPTPKSKCMHLMASGLVPRGLGYRIKHH